MNFFSGLTSKMRNFYYKYFFTDKTFLEKYYKVHTGKELDLMNPKEFGEKLQWLKLYWFDSMVINYVDKYEVRNVLKAEIGNEYLNELYAVYDSIEEINIEDLPNSFVLKATHSSGQNFVCKDKNKVDWNKQLLEIKKWFDTNYFLRTREWVYKDIKPRVICERYLVESGESTSLTDYKIYCFNGIPTYCQVIKDRSAGGTIDFFDTQWNHMDFTGLQKMPNSSNPLKKPRKYDEMLDISREISKEYPFVRVDFYYVKGKVFFGELTFFPRSGFGTFNPQKWNRKMGDLLELPSGNIN